MMRRLSQRLLVVLALAAVACGGGAPTQPTAVRTPTASAPSEPPAEPTPEPAPGPTPEPTPSPAPEPVPAPPETNPPRLAVTRLLAFGDSLTAGYVQDTGALRLLGDVSYPSKLQMLLASTYTAQSISVVNAGKLGEWASDALPRFQATLATTQPQVVLLLEGDNDLNTLGERGLNAATEGLDSMMNEARRRGIPVLIGTLPPTRPDGFRGPSLAEIVRLNDQIRNLAREPYSAMVDLYGAFGNDASLLIGPDGLHPNDAGYLRIAVTFFEAIQRRFGRSPAGSSLTD